jgi:hypothetical protein
MQFNSTEFQARLRAALADEAPETKADNAGPFRWTLTPTRNAQGYIESVDLRPIARINADTLPEMLP